MTTAAGPLDSPRHEASNAEATNTAWDEHPANPFNFPKRRKWTVILAAAAVTLLVGLNATSIATPALVVAEEFHVSDDGFPNSFWPITVWNTGAALGPMIGLPLLENFGSRSGYLLCYAAFTIFVIPQAVAPNFATLLAVRGIAGALGGILQNAIEMFLADIFLTDEERNLPITLFTFVLAAGVTLGPVFGAIVHQLSWRWVFYIQLIIYSSLFPILLLAIPETRGPVLLSTHARKEPHLTSSAPETKKPPLSTLFRDAIVRPTRLLCTEPVVFFLTLWSSFCFGLVFILTQSVAQVYSTNYAFSDGASGLIQSSLFIGEIVGFLACIPQNSYYQRSGTKNRKEPGTPIPEARLPLSIPASLLGLAGGMFWYGWAGYPHVHWMLPTVGLGFVGFAIMVIITTVDMYLTDSYTKYAGSAVAAVAFGENIFAAWLPLAANKMYTVLGFQWASSLLGFVAVALTLAPVVLYFRGEAIRRRSPFIKEASYL
ncbi:MAG: hypothetical protein Q9174_001912 [Haloplaca sp. 1 TL-2023]